MTKKEWFTVLIPVPLVWLLDLLTKLIGAQFVEPTQLGFITLKLHHNYGAILGTFSDLPEFLRVVSLSTGGAFLVCLYAALQYLLPIRSMMLRVGMGILLGGILGNVTDRIIWGYVRDFILMDFHYFRTGIFNVSDVMQWPGLVLIIMGLYKEINNLFPEDDKRKVYWININYQLKFCFILVSVGLGIFLISGTFAFTYLKVALAEVIGPKADMIAKFTHPFLIIYIVMSLAFLSLLFLVGRQISHRSAGPLYAFERFLRDTMAGKKVKLKLRSKDEFKSLEVLAEQLQSYFTESKK